ncbi:protease inhibitor I42 family protein [Kitasatospora sp. NPDC047058]|uniref:protease inhibitor I42 family protein n=1 Tax=Kitasatospora sp. NPDC047058 TaxID=3155620 RepID=UPI00340723A7
MKRRWRRVLVTVAALLAVAATVGAVAVHRMTTGKLDHGTVFARTSGQFTVKPGELFSIEVFAYQDAGDNWTMAAPSPDPAVVQAAGDEYVDDFGVKDVLGFGLGGTGDLGTGGHYYFTFRAQSPGRTTITVHVAYRDALGGTFSGGPDQTKRQFTIDVR